MKALYLRESAAFLRYLELPNAGDSVVWLHGVLCSSTGELVRAAVEPVLRGYRHVLVDFLGHGYSDRPAAFGYGIEDHARTVITLIDELGLHRAAIVGHSLGGNVATLVAAARPDKISILVLAESTLELGGGFISGPIASMSEEDFVRSGFREMLARQEREADDEPTGLRAVHLGITRSVDPRAIHRAATSIVRGTDPTTARILRDLPMRRHFVNGERSEGAVQPRAELLSAGVAWHTVPASGHAMALDNPPGFARIIAESLAAGSVAQPSF